MRIYLIGFMGSGKSHLGKLLAGELNFKFVDSDKLIENSQQQSISKIINNKGEDFFRNLEKEVLRKSISRMQNTVIATGGGMPCFNDNIKQMLKSGLVIYLKTDTKTLLDRLKNDKKRPLLKNKDLEKFITELLEVRKVTYEEGVVIENADVNSLKKLV